MKSLIISILLLLPIGVQAQTNKLDRIKMVIDSLEHDSTLSKYERRVVRQYVRWTRMIPSQSIIQNAGNMGALSLGIGWDYGKREQWETHLLIGYIPKHDTDKTRLTMTLKETYKPWELNVCKDLYANPLTCGIYLNTVFGSDFWGRQPSRYPKNYYNFLSTKVRINVFLGQQIAWNIPYTKRRTRRSVCLFYEVSTCDLYLRAFLMEKNVRLKNIVGLSLGAKKKFL
jgi:hypothetical protein